MKDLGGSGLTSELAIANLVPKPGFTDLVIYLYDQNGLLDYVCQKLTEKQVEYIDLQTWGYVNQGYKGSAVISAWFWEHDVFDPTGFYLRNLVGLGAVAVERMGARLGEDVPGDEAAAARGIPFANTFDEDGEAVFEFCPMGPPPLCPGFPDLRPDPDECGDVSGECENCPQSIPSAGTSGMMSPAFVELSIGSACRITDVDVTLDINHTWIGDLQIDVTSPDGTTSRIANGICGNFDNIMAVVDDDAAAPLGSVCPPVGFLPYTSDSGVALNIFDGEGANGVWQLDINDTAVGDLGTLNNWIVDVETR